MKLTGGIRKPLQLAGNLLLLLVVLAAGWMLLSARGSPENFKQMRPLINQVNDACKTQNRCPTSQQFEDMAKQAGIDQTRLRYFPGEYAIPGKGKAFETTHSGEQYFRLLYLPMTDYGYHASGGKDVELVLWNSVDGINTRLN